MPECIMVTVAYILNISVLLLLFSIQIILSILKVRLKYSHNKMREKAWSVENKKNSVKAMTTFKEQAISPFVILSNAT